MAKTHKEWEKPLTDLEDGIAKYRDLVKRETDPERKATGDRRLAEFEESLQRSIEAMYKSPSPWENVLIARAERRPYALDYIQAICQSFIELEGDRHGFCDHAIIGGPAILDGKSVMIVGHQKGRNIQERQIRNFGMAKPEGYRKAIRLFEMADRFKMPVIAFIDTPAADPLIDSESRGISEAIAASMLKMFELRVPSIAVIIGEGGSGGAIGIAATNRVLMQEHAVYSVIPPEGCAAILWRAADRAEEAAQALKLTAGSAKELGLIDEIIPEPRGGAHRDWPGAAGNVKLTLLSHLRELIQMSESEIRQQRYQRFRAMGAFNRDLASA